VYVGGLCRGHYARRARPDALAPLRPKRGKGEVETLSGVILSRQAADAIRATAKESGRSEHAVMVDVLESWARDRLKGQ
jgi:hypothetical protein